MAAGDGSDEPADNRQPPNGATSPPDRLVPPSVRDDSEDEDDDDDDDDDEEEEPRLKYANLTRNLSPLYRNGDATSTFLVAGDKMASPSNGFPIMRSRVPNTL